MLNILVFLAYLVLAWGVAGLLPERYPVITSDQADALGAGLLLVLALLHLGALHFGISRKLRAEIFRLRGTQDETLSELARTRKTAQLILNAKRGKDGEEEVSLLEKIEGQVQRNLVNRLFNVPDKAELIRSIPQPAPEPLAAQRIEETESLRVRVGPASAEKTKPPAGGKAKKGSSEKKSAGKAPRVSAQPAPVSDGLEPTLKPSRSRGEEAQILDEVRDALNNGRIDLMLQPIVSLPQRKLHFFECFSRLRTGDKILSPNQYLDIALREGLIAAIDNMLLFRCIQLVRDTQKRNRNLLFFCNISTHSLLDKEFFEDFMRFLLENHELAPSLVFEVSQHDMAQLDETDLADLDRLAHFGFRFSVDQVGRLDMNYEELARHRVKFIKAPVDLLLEEVRDKGDLRELKQMLDLVNLDLIVDKVETEDQVLELLDQPIDFAQGFLFGKPRLTRESK
ncbi:MAG: EAL domain-containing protein [Rhodospirillaceae bacterium]|jgi:cyclic-di-GMP phosphodiesterase, flagellum assembly factor TipF|nr:EAL domain-containing protein [Rhodospirillaceae bacterium]MBT5659223.1 EAL domain-containing protein [Rhodospirillaceae bacterium]